MILKLKRLCMVQCASRIREDAFSAIILPEEMQTSGLARTHAFVNILLCNKNVRENFCR